jgi:hypothetical protein
MLEMPPDRLKPQERDRGDPVKFKFINQCDVEAILFRGSGALIPKKAPAASPGLPSH